MRILNICAALSGALALVMLVIAAHVLPLEAADADRVRMGAYMQLFAAAAALAIANRVDRINLIAGALVLGGAALFAGALYTLAIAHARNVVMLAPIGGISMILGWLALAFARPGT